MRDLQDKKLAICHECDLLVNIDSLREGCKAACPRCGYVITKVHKNGMERMLVFSFTALLFLLASSSFTFIKLGVEGYEQALSLLQIVEILLSMDAWALGLFMLIVIVGIPVLFIVVLGWLVLSIKLRMVSTRTIWLLRIVDTLKFWNMAEIFFLGVLISMIKVVTLADIDLGLSFWAYALFNVFLIATILHVDNFQLANTIRLLSREKPIITPLLDLKDNGQHSLAACHHCATVQSAAEHRCIFCDSVLHKRKPDSLQRTWLYLITGIVMYIPANVWPIMKTNTLGDEVPSTIVGGVILLWEHGSYPIAAVIFIASVVVPIAKFLVLLGLLLSERFGVYDRPNSKVILYRIIEFVGRWSMVDVFVVAFLASMIQLGNLMSIYPGPAVAAFGGMVVATILAAKSFDPRLFWDNPKRKA